MVSSVQRTEVADVASLFIGCDMNNRFTWSVVAGVAAVCASTTGHCGRVTLEGNAPGTYTYDLVVEARRARWAPNGQESVSVGCGSWSLPDAVGVGGGEVKPPEDMTITGDTNDLWCRADKRDGGQRCRWVPAQPPSVSPISRLHMTVTCTNRNHPAWVRSNLKIYRNDDETSHLAVTVSAPGVAASYRWEPRAGGAWSTPSVLYGDADRTGSVGLSYPESMVLGHRGATAKLLYDVTTTGDVGLAAQIRTLPSELRCTRVSDGLKIYTDMVVGIDRNDAIECTNTMNRRGQTRGSITVAAMIK